MRIKDVVNLCNVKTDDHSKPYVALENIESWNSKFIPSESVSEGMNNVFDAGDILFGKLRPYLAKAYIPNFDGICSTEFFVLKPKKGFDSRYLLYRLLMPSFIWYINSRVTGVKMPRTNWNDFSNVEIDIPSLPVQRRIVSYLDSKTSEIDQAISLLEQKREAYTRLKASVINRAVTRGLNPNVKLKDSGVAWIGKIPEGWDLIPLKGNIALIKGKTPNKLTFDNTGVPYLTMDYLRGRDDKTILYPEDSEGLYHIKANEIIVLWDGANAGEFILSKNGYLGSTMAHIEVNNKVYNNEYFYYLMKSLESTSKYFASGTTIPHFDPQILFGRYYPSPSLAEQRSIASYLDAECSKLDRAASIVEKEIDAYKRLKRSLINEVVTGKRKVD
jgi:type I restriction enzyme S subunit